MVRPSLYNIFVLHGFNHYRVLLVSIRHHSHQEDKSTKETEIFLLQFLANVTGVHSAFINELNIFSHKYLSNYYEVMFNFTLLIYGGRLFI